MMVNKQMLLFFWNDFALTASCCLLGMYKEGDLLTTLLNILTPIVLVALGLIMPAIKKREKTIQ